MWKPTDSVTFRRFFAQQARRPSGLFGRFVAKRIFDRGNRKLNVHMVQAVSASGQERVLEIGFGTGSVLSMLAESLDGGSVDGIDFSETMVAAAAQLNRHHIQSGVVNLIQGDFDSASIATDFYHAACSSNTVYFWRQREATCRKIYQVLKPGGRCVLAFVAKEKMESMPLDMDLFNPVSGDDIVTLMQEAGFVDVTIDCVVKDGSQLCVRGVKPSGE